MSRNRSAAEPKKVLKQAPLLRLFRSLFSISTTLLPVYFLVIRPWHLRWGATDDEVHRFLPGDDLVPTPQINATHAITVNAHAADIWPWLVQMGWKRGGFYSYTFVENQMSSGFQNAKGIVPEFQQLKEGDSIPLAPAGDSVVSLEVAVLEREYALVLHGDTRQDPESVLVKPGDYMHTTWGFYLDERPDGTTRLIERFQLDFNKTLRNRLFYRLFVEPGTFIMERKMLLNIKKLAEAGYEKEHTEVASANNGRVAV